MPARVRIVGQPDVAFNMLLQHEDMVTADSSHARCWLRTWEAKPGRCKPKLPYCVAEYSNGSPTTAKCARGAASWMGQDVSTSNCRYSQQKGRSQQEFLHKGVLSLQ